MKFDTTLGAALASHGVSRRGFMKYCAALTSLMALPPAMAPKVAAALEAARRPSVIWLSFQECTGCTEALTRSHAPTLEELILQMISLDYHHTLQAASGAAAEEAREHAMKENYGKYIVLVDGSIPTANPGYSTIAGISNKDMLMETVAGAAAVVSIGTCAAYGGLPMAHPNPTGAVPVSALVKDKPIVNLPGCPPIPVVMTGVIAHYLAFGQLPELDAKGRPMAFYGEAIHDRCYRRPYYDRGLFAKSFDDEGAKKGWCLFELGCKGPTTYNACATVKWNDGVSFPIQAGHGCIGCSQPDFWDAGGFYEALSVPTGGSDAMALAAMGGGIAAGIAAGAAGVAKRKKASGGREAVTLDDLQAED